MMNDVWCNCIEYAAKEVGLDLTLEQIQRIADACEREADGIREHSGSPGASAFVEVLQRDHRQALSTASYSHEQDAKQMRQTIENLEYENKRLRRQIYDLQRD